MKVKSPHTVVPRKLIGTILTRCVNIGTGRMCVNGTDVSLFPPNTLHKNIEKFSNLYSLLQNLTFKKSPCSTESPEKYGIGKVGIGINRPGIWVYAVGKQ